VFSLVGIVMLTGCGDDVADTDTGEPAVECDGGCPPWEYCDIVTNECLPLPGADSGVGDGTDARDLPTTDVDETDAGEVEEGDVGDTGEPTDADDDDDDTRDLLIDSDVPLQDPSNPEVDLYDDLDSHVDFDVETIHDLDAADQLDGEPDVSTDPDADDEPDLGDVPVLPCPSDRLEGEDGNNTIANASRLHESVVAGTVGARSPDREVLECGALSFLVADSPIDCERDTCECTFVENLGACGEDDADYHRFSLLVGDLASVRIAFAPPIIIANLDAIAIGPPVGRECGASTECREDLGDACFGGECRHVVEGEWIDTDDSDLDPDAIQIDLEPATGDGIDSGVLVEHWLLVNSDLHDVTYSVLVQVAPVSRSCHSDDWDADWDDYDSATELDVGCLVESCTAEAGHSDDSPPDPVLGQICIWDRQDFVRHVITEDDAVGGDRLIRVRWLEREELTVDSFLFMESDGGLTEVGSVPPLDSPGEAQGRFESLAPGTYQLRISSPDVVGFEAIFYTDI
jgi:hypothetical protein